MKKTSLLVIMLLVLFGIQPVFAADVVETTAEVVEEVTVVEETVEVPAPAAEVTAEVSAEATVLESPAAENLEFVSGEVTALDEAGSNLTIKLYGETGDGTSDKSIVVNVDPNTDITDGEKDRELKSLAAGTEVDVEYDPATNKATYIFVY